MIIVSACLAGKQCRYDGRTCTNSDIVELVHKGEAIPVCPEELGGLPTPRPPAEKFNESYQTNTGIDVTENYIQGAQLAWETSCQKTRELTGESVPQKAILKSKSPMCGVSHIYDGTFSGKLTEGTGEFAKLLKEKGLTLEERD